MTREIKTFSVHKVFERITDVITFRACSLNLKPKKKKNKNNH
jgi:hypothetical protein